MVRGTLAGIALLAMLGACSGTERAKNEVKESNEKVADKAAEVRDARAELTEKEGELAEAQAEANAAQVKLENRIDRDTAARRRP